VESRRCISVSSRPLRVGILVLIRSWGGYAVTITASDVGCACGTTSTLITLQVQ
jgi:hypothetical protein